MHGPSGTVPRRRTNPSDPDLSTLTGSRPLLNGSNLLACLRVSHEAAVRSRASAQDGTLRQRVGVQLKIQRPSPTGQDRARPRRQRSAPTAGPARLQVSPAIQRLPSLSPKARALVATDDACAFDEQQAPHRRDDTNLDGRRSYGSDLKYAVAAVRRRCSVRKGRAQRHRDPGGPCAAEIAVIRRLRSFRAITLYRCLSRRQAITFERSA